MLQPLISALIEEGLLGNMPPPSLELNDETNLLMFFDELERTPGHWAWSELYDHADWMLVSLVGDEACRRVADGMTHAGMPVFLPAQKGVSA